ncbi:IS1380 family transposase [Kibdelosporangium philippinense]|uniref:IS1380 family transposase n=1 Tax=Kibdelosporangium philippinense TaxID=211113 RepID=UPI003612393D
MKLWSTFDVDVTGWSRDLAVEVGGRGVVSHAGTAAVRLLADRTGLTEGLSRAMARRGFMPVHDRGRVFADTAVLIADGGRVLSDLAVLRDQAELFGPVASDPTLWRTLDAVGQVQRNKIARVRARIREHVWSLIERRHGRIPPSRVADRDLGTTVVVRLDGSLVIAHSDKQLAAGTYKGSFGHHPLLAMCDNTGESLALLLRTGSAGSNTTADHLEVLDAAIAQIPAKHRRNLLVTVDGAGASHGLIKYITALNAKPGRQAHYSVGWELGARERAAIGRVPAKAWQAVLDHHGDPRPLDKAGVVELTALLRHHPDGDQLENWPADLRIICRREKPHPGAQLSLFEEADGWRYQLVATNTPGSGSGATVQFLEARHRPHARVEDHVRCGKQTGLGHLPSTKIEINRAWCLAATIAIDLLAWLRLLCLESTLAKAEPKTLRYRLLHTAARIVRGQRKRKIKIPETWPWADPLAACLRAALALPPPTR